MVLNRVASQFVAVDGRSYEIEFDPGAHVYRVGGRIVPSVTGVLDAAGFIDKTFYDQESAWRGQIVHRATELFDRGDLYWDEIHEPYRGYVEAWIRFVEEMHFIPDLIECRVFHPVHWYAGTLDRTGVIWWNGAYHRVILDIKTGVRADWWAYQTAAYDFTFPTRRRRMCVELHADGSYRIDPHKNPRDIGVFLSSLVTTRAKGLLNERAIRN